MGKIFASGELARSAVVKDILITAQNGARGLSEDKVVYYNLDAIISVGYSINSLRATKFRIWSKSIIKEYMRINTVYMQLFTDYCAPHFHHTTRN